MFKFSLGKMVATVGAMQTLTQDDIVTALNRHANGDWGNVPDEDKQANEQSLKTNGRLLSEYRAKDGTRFWIHTEDDRSVTTVMLPDEY